MGKTLFIAYNCLNYLNVVMELIKKNQELGNDIYVQYCTGQLKHLCNQGLRLKLDGAKKNLCADCVRNFRYGMKLTNIPKQNQFELQIPNKLPDVLNSEFTSYTEIQNLEVDGINIFSCSLENLLDYRKTLDFDFSDSSFKKIAKQLLTVSYLSYYNTKSNIIKLNHASIYIGNNRKTENFPIVEMCEKKNIDFYIFEGYDVNEYSIRHNMTLHKYNDVITYFKQCIDKFTNDKINIAKEWFENRIQNGAKQHHLSFNEYQEKKCLPDGFKSSTKNISFFNSSWWENISFDGWEFPEEFIDETRVLEKLCNEFKDSNMHFYLRVHPHLGIYGTIDQVKHINMLKSKNIPNLTIIDAKSNVDTYHLIERSDIVIVHNSTTGVESCYLGTPTITLFNAIYSCLNVAYQPKTMHELIDLVSCDLPPKPQVNALPYGYYETIFGTAFEYYEPLKLGYGKFMGKEFNPFCAPKSRRSKIRRSKIRHFLKFRFILRPIENLFKANNYEN